MDFLCKLRSVIWMYKHASGNPGGKDKQGVE